jgi:hypothetical protein
VERSNDETSYIHCKSAGCKGAIIPGESDFVQKFLSVWSHFVFGVTLPLARNPDPKRRVFFVLLCHRAMSFLSFKLDEFFMLLVPELVVWCEVAGFPSEPGFVQNSFSINSNFVVLV